MYDVMMIENKVRAMRRLALEGLCNAGSGHPGGSLSAADIVATLYSYKLRIDSSNPVRPDRDRFVLSKGHACPIYYAALAEKGFFPRDDVRRLRTIDCHLQGHPDMRKTPGVDMSTGSLGQGLSVGVGMAYAGKLDGKDYRVYCLLGCGECQEGQVWEAAMSAAHFKLDNLVAIVDYNHLQIDGSNEEVMNIADLGERFRASRWQVIEIDGHDISRIAAALDEADKAAGRPTVIIAETIKGKGVSFMENQVDWHGKAPNRAELAQALQELGGAY